MAGIAGQSPKFQSPRPYAHHDTKALEGALIQARYLAIRDSSMNPPLHLENLIYRETKEGKCEAATKRPKLAMAPVMPKHQR